MSYMEQLDDKLKELKERGVVGISITVDQDKNASQEELARDVLRMVEAMDTATPMAELRDV